MRQTVSRLLPVGSFARSVGVLTGGTIGARAILALSLPLVTRLYSPTDFELLAIYMAVLSLVTVIASLRLNMAITLPAEDGEAANLLALSLLAAAVFGIVLSVPVIFVPDLVAGVIGQPGMLPLLWMIPLGILLAAAYQALQYWASRKRRFGLVARTRVARAVGGAGTQLGLGFAGIAPFGLLLGHMIYSGLGIVGLVRDLLRNDRGALAAVSPGAMWRALVAYRRFPIWSVPEALANSAGMQVPVIVIAAIALGPEAGYLALAMQVMAMPMALVGQSVAQVFIAEAPARLRDGTLTAFTRRTALTLFALGAAVLVPLGLLAPYVFGPIFGAEWARAGEIVLWMTPWHILQFTASPVSTVLHVTGHLRVAMALQFIGAALRIGAVALAGALAAGWISEVYALSGAVFYGIYIGVVYVIAVRSTMDGRGQDKIHSTNVTGKK
ncbi:oligosaccharide flippase family protein [Roseovarius sp. MBR-6]|uniref:lipopolysaccharide biosynthesis protein n=1 Tax=Roseovarius sp. MBR-6 TaxID=3156459 RepID=UPI003394832D